MDKALGSLSWAINGNAAVIDLAFLTHNGALAARAHTRHLPRLRVVGAKGKHGP